MDPTYFTCTLGQANSLGQRKPIQTINELVDSKAEEEGDTPAVGFYEPRSKSSQQWGARILTFPRYPTCVRSSGGYHFTEVALRCRRNGRPSLSQLPRISIHLASLDEAGASGPTDSTAMLTIGYFTSLSRHVSFEILYTMACTKSDSQGCCVRMR